MSNASEHLSAEQFRAQWHDRPHVAPAAGSPAARLIEGLQALTPGVRYSGIQGASNTVIKQEREVDDYVPVPKSNRTRHRVGTLRTTHAYVQNVTGEVFHPEWTQHSSVEEALRKAAEDGADAWRGGYLSR